MATSSLQTIVSDIRVFPYSGLTQTVRENSGIARATVTASVDSQEITSTSGAVIRSVVLSASLPQNYSYVMTDAYIQLTADAAANVLTQLPDMGFESNWRGMIVGSDATSRFNMVCDNIVKTESDIQAFGATDFRVPPLDVVGATWHGAYLGDYNGQNDSYERIYTPNVLPKSVFRGSGGPVTLNLNIANMVKAPFGGGIFVNARFNFVQYDIDQAYNYLLHTPQLVR